MAKEIKRTCPACGQEKKFRGDQKTCGCQGSNPFRGGPKELKETNEISGDMWTVVLPKTRIHTLEQLIAFCKIDLSIWEVERFIANKWEMPYTIGTDDNKTADVEPVFQIKAFLRKKPSIIAAKKEIEALKQLAKQHAPTPFLISKPNNAGMMLEVNITDHHFGKLAWGLETGHANYDVKIAAQVFNRALETILQRASSHKYEEIWFVVGNDLFNSDDTTGRTTAGTYVESDVRHEKTYVIVRTLLISAIERLRTLTNIVKVIVVPGNHDHNATWHLGDSLECFFHKYEDVEVDNHPSARKYHRFGNTLIMYTHGDKGKLGDLPLLMAAEQPALFGQTQFHEIHTGHIHTSRVNEYHGVRVRILSALCPPDAWHAENGFVGNLRSSEAFQWDKIEGLIGTIIYTDSDSKIEKASEIPTAAQG